MPTTRARYRWLAATSGTLVFAAACIRGGDGWGAPPDLDASSDAASAPADAALDVNGEDAQARHCGQECAAHGGYCGRDYSLLGKSFVTPSGIADTTNDECFCWQGPVYYCFVDRRCADGGRCSPRAEAACSNVGGRMADASECGVERAAGVCCEPK